MADFVLSDNLVILGTFDPTTIDKTGTGAVNFTLGGSENDFVIHNVADDRDYLNLDGDNEKFTIGFMDVTIDQTDVEALLVRKVGDTGDIFIVDTTNDEVELGSGVALQWSTDLKLFRDAANTLALRNATTDQIFRIYGTFTNSTNFERLAIYASGSGYFVEPQTQGTGVDNLALTLRPAGAGAMTIGDLASAAVTLRSGNNFNFTTGTNQTGVSWSIADLNATTPALSGATGVLGGFLPANAIIQSLTFRVTTEITGATSFDIGDGVTADRWGSTRPIGLGTTSDVGDYTVDTGPFYTAASLGITFTANGGSFTGGVIRAIVIYSLVQPPTS